MFDRFKLYILQCLCFHNVSAAPRWQKKGFEFSFQSQKWPDLRLNCCKSEAWKSRAVQDQTKQHSFGAASHFWCTGWNKTDLAWPGWTTFYSQARPMTRYLPNRKEEFDLRAHVESSGHSVDTCPFVILTEKMCKGHLVKMGGKIKSWKKRWFVFDRLKRNFSYYVGEDMLIFHLWNFFWRHVFVSKFCSACPVQVSGFRFNRSNQRAHKIIRSHTVFIKLWSLDGKVPVQPAETWFIQFSRQQCWGRILWRMYTLLSLLRFFSTKPDFCPNQRLFIWNQTLIKAALSGTFCLVLVCWSQSQLVIHVYQTVPWI